MNNNLNSFLAKTRKYQEQKLKGFKMEIKDFGELELVRPTGVDKDALMDYQDKMTSNMLITGKAKDGKDIMQIVSMKKYFEIASELVYMCCPMMQADEVIKEFGNDNLKVPLRIFEPSVVTRISSEISEKFDAKKEKKEKEKEIKN